MLDHMAFDVTLIISPLSSSVIARPEKRRPDIDATEDGVYADSVVLYGSRVYPGDTQEDVMDRMRKFQDC